MCVAVYDPGDEKSYREAERWLLWVSGNREMTDIEVVLVANKRD